MTTHVVQFSTGLGSAEVARRVVAEHGVDNVHLLTADTLVEDPDNWRFANQAHEFIGAPQWTVLTDGRTPMEVGRDERVVPNNRFAVCSRVLKRDLLRKHIDATYDPADTVICLGFDWSEGHRLDAATPHWAPYEVDAPLMRKPWSAKWDLIRQWRDFGIEPPRLYEQGFGHANCFAPETRFITDRGIKTLEETVGTTVRVLGKGGGWKDAEVRSFGEQPLTKVELKRYSDTKTVFVTADHQWPVRKAAGRTDFRMKTTADLVPGQRIASMYGRVAHNVVPSTVGIMAGFTFGDGTAPVMASGQNPPAKAFLIGEKDAALLPYFAGCRMKRRDEQVLEVLDLPRAWKRAPDTTESQSYLYGWLAGYFAADGSFGGGMAKLSSAKKENLEVVRDVCARLGMGTHAIREEKRLGYGVTESSLFGVALMVSTLREDFFLIDEHRRRFNARPLSTPRPADWQVVSVEATERRSEVMCAVVGDGHMFTLEDNVYTHNCGGACVRGGQAQWELLLQVNRATYVEWEGEEQKTRDLLGKDVSILRDRRGGTVTPLTLRTFRERLEQDATLFDSDDWGACGCT